MADSADGTRGPVSVSRDGGRVVVDIHGIVEGDVVHRLLHDLVEDQGNRSLSVRLHTPDALDALGVAALICVSRRLDERNGMLAVDGAHDDVRMAVALQGSSRRQARATIPQIDATIQGLYRVGLALRTHRTESDGDAVLHQALELLDETLSVLGGAALRVDGAERLLTARGEQIVGGDRER